MESKSNTKEVLVPHIVLNPNQKSFDQTVTLYSQADGKDPNCEEVTVNGVTVTIPYGQDVRVPIEIAERLKETGRITSYRMVKETIQL